jgi:hypothetical protein
MAQLAMRKLGYLMGFGVRPQVHFMLLAILGKTLQIPFHHIHGDQNSRSVQVVDVHC